MVNALKKIKLPSRARGFLVILLCADMFYISLHIIRKLALSLNIFQTMQNDVFDISRDLGLGESFQYAQEFWITILFLWLIFKHRKTAYAGWALLFTYVLLDDMLSIHEKMGTILIRLAAFSPFVTIKGGLRYQDIGELGVSLVFGSLILSLIGYAYLRSSRETRTVFHYLTGGLTLIVFFGVAFDLARQFPAEGRNLLHGLSVIEDGGEMFTMSLMCWYLYNLTDTEAGME